MLSVRDHSSPRYGLLIAEHQLTLDGLRLLEAAQRLLRDLDCNQKAGFSPLADLSRASAPNRRRLQRLQDGVS